MRGDAFTNLDHKPEISSGSAHPVHGQPIILLFYHEPPRWFDGGVLGVIVVLGMLIVNDNVSIRSEELRFTFTRSGGPGGQNVNKVNSRVTLTFDILASPALSDEQKTLLLRRLGRQVNKQGVLRLVCQRHRSQHANRAEAIARFTALLADVLRPVRARKRTCLPRSAKIRRYADKQHRSRLKQQRRPPPHECRGSGTA